MRSIGIMNPLWLIVVALVECSATKLQINDKIMNEIQHLTNAVVSRHFSESRCIGVVTETPGVYLVETEVPVFYITNDGTNNTLDRLLLSAINAGCYAFVLQVNDIKWMVEKLTKLFRSPASVNRANRRYIYLPTVGNEEVSLKAVINEVFTCKSMNWMPDLLIVNLIADQEALSNMGFLKQMRSNRSNNDTHGRGNLFRTSQELDFVLEVYTHQFVGKNPSEAVLLDIWVPGQGFVYEVDLFPDKLKNLMGREVKTMSLPYIPFTVINMDTDPPSYDGIEFQALLEYGRKRNITWIMQHDFVNWWGDVWDNGSGIGLIGAIAEDRTDISVSALYMLNKGFSYMDYSMPFYQSDLTTVTPRPQMIPTYLIPTMPFTSSMWYAVLISTVVIVLVLYIVSKAADALLGSDMASRYSSLLECTFQTSGMLVLQAPGDDVYAGYRYVPLRHFIAWVVLYFLVITSAYAGGLSAILTVPQFQPPIETMRDLADSGLKWYGTDDAYVFPIYKSTDPTIKTIIDNYIVRSEDDISELAYQDNSVLLVERLQGGYFTHLKYISVEVMQNKRLMKEAIVPEHLVFVLSKGSSYKETFNAILHQLRQSGIPLYWERETGRRYLSQRLQLSILDSRVPSSSHHIKLSFSHVQGAFFLLVLGLLLAVVAFMLELLSFHSTAKNKRERD